jgi:hypothetical protein
MKKIKIEKNDWNDIEEILKEYWYKIQHIQLRSIPSCEYIKKPYVENMLFQYVAWNSKIEIDEIPYEDIFLYIKNHYPCTPDEKSNIQKYLYVHSHTPDEHTLSIHVVRFMIEYIRFYMTIVDFVYGKEQKSKELSTFIYIVWNEHKKGTQKYSKSMHFILFSHLLDKTYQSYKQMIQTLLQKKLLQEKEEEEEDETTETEKKEKTSSMENVKSIFYKNIFAPWLRISSPNYDASLDSTDLFFPFSQLLCMNYES